MGNYSSTSDVERYRQGYPGQEDDLNAKNNLKFYSNQLASRPEGDLIESIHKDWWGQYELLERHHGYVQWLFPIREHGLNGYAQVLQLHEAQAISSDPVMVKRCIKSYELMLDFYGMKLIDAAGHIGRSDGFRDRYTNLNHSFHNYLRITRILKFLGEMGLESMKVHFIEFVLNEVKQGELANTYDSCSKYWIEVLKNDQDRQRMKDLAATIKPPQRQYRRWNDDSDDEDEKKGKGTVSTRSNNNNNNNNNSGNNNNENTNSAPTSTTKQNESMEANANESSDDE